ncbi:MAG: tetratricopeptide repeat protein [Chitinivibrionales bacterium]|nr:tetratricopeptide repeat protein [Chitinivibrionales bacterium]
MRYRNRLFLYLTVACLFLFSPLFPLFADDTFNNLIKEGKYTEALHYAQQPAAAGTLSVENWTDLAVAFEKKSAPAEQIIACYKEALKAYPRETRFLLAVGSLYYRTKNYTEALSYFQTSYLTKRSAFAAEYMALCAANLGQWEKAKDAAESALAIDSSVTECRPILIKIYSEEKNWAEVVNHLEFLIKKGPAKLALCKQLVETYQTAGMQERFPFVDSIIIRLDSTDVASRTRFAEHSIQNRDTATAIHIYKELTLLTPSDPRPMRNLYLIAKSRGTLDEAMRYLRSMLTLDSSNTELFWDLADMAYVGKDTTRALEAYRRAFQRDPQVRGHYRTYGGILLQRKLDNEAVNVITAASRLGEADSTLLIALGDIYRKRDQCQAAVVQYQEVLKIDPRNLSVLASLADCQNKTGDIKNAIISYEQIVLMNPQSSQEYKILGTLHLKNGNQQAAIVSLRRYLENAKTDYGVAKTVGLSLYENKEFADAVKYLGTVADQSLHDGAYLVALGLSAFHTNDCKTAIETLTKEWKMRPNQTVLRQILLPLAQCHERGGSELKAAEAYEAYSKLPGVRDADVDYRVAYLKEKNDRAGAFRQYVANIKAYPRDYRNFLRLGLLYSADDASLPKAASMLTIASTMVDTSLILWRTLATVENKLKHENKEVVALLKVLSLVNNDVESNRRIGMIYASRKQYDKAITSLEIVHAAGATDYELLQLLATCYQETKRPKEAIALLRKAKTSRPEDTALLLRIIATADIVGGAENAEAERDELAQIDKKIIAKDSRNIQSRTRLVGYYYDKSNFNGAVPVLEELAVLTPKDPTIFRKLYDITMKNGNKKVAVEYLKKYAALDSTNTNAFKNCGDLLYEQKDFEGALTAYRKAFSINPNIKGIFKNYLSILLQMKNEVEGMIVFRSAMKCGETELSQFLYFGSLYSKRNNCLEAAKLYREALKLDPKNLEALTGLGECQVKVGETKEALQTYEQVVLMNPKPGKAYKTLGDLQLKAGQHDAAMGSYQKYIAETPSDQAIVKLVGVYKYTQKKYQEAIGLLETIKTGGLIDAEYLTTLGESYYYAGQHAKAIEPLSRVRAAKGAKETNVKILKMLADCYYKINESAKALELYDLYVQTPGIQDVEASYLCGYLREKSDVNGAKKVYAANTIQFPKDYRNFFRLGVLLSTDSTSYDKAVASLKGAAAISDTAIVLWETVARLSNKMHDENGEMHALQKLLQLQPQNYEANKRISVLLLNKKQIPQAITNLEMMLTTMPNDIPTLQILAECYKQTKRYSNAIDILQKARKLDKTTPSIRYGLYELYKLNGQETKADSEIKELIELTKDNKYRILYGQSLIARQKFEDAQKLVVDIKASEPTNIEGLMLYASVQKAHKQLEDAIETYKDISYIKENYIPALYGRGDIYLLMEKYDRAKQFFEKVLKIDPKHALSEYGLSLAAKGLKDSAAYKEHLAKAKALDPKNPLFSSGSEKSTD